MKYWLADGVHDASVLTVAFTVYSFDCYLLTLAYDIQ